MRNLRRGIRVSTALAIVFGLAFSWASWHTENARESAYMSSLVELGEKSLDSYFLSLQTALAMLGEDIRDKLWGVDMNRAEPLMKRFKKSYPDLRIVILARSDGQVLLTTEPTIGRQLPTLAHEASFMQSRKELQQGEAISIGRPFFGPVSKEWVIPIRYGLRDEHGDLRYLLGAGLPLAKAQSFWKEASLPPGAALGLVRKDGYLVSRYPIPDRSDLKEIYGKPRSGALMNFLWRENFPRSGTIGGTSSVSFESTDFAFRRLSHFPITLYIANPRSNTWAAWWQNTWVSYLLILLWIAGGVLVYLWARGRQITWELERAQKVTELEQANEELDSFAYSISHDLNAPVRAIDGYTAILIEGLETMTHEEARRTLAIMQSNARRMGQLIGDLLALSRYSRKPIQKQDVDVEELVKSVLADAVPEEGRIEVKLGQLRPCQADPALLRQVFVNLISNAVKFSREAASPVIEIGWAQGAYFVRDNGVGFDMSQAENLFDAFSRLHRTDQFEGTGVGLAIVKRIIERHGGRICARAEIGKGAIFSFAFG